jgi:hypothetical protein
MSMNNADGGGLIAQSTFEHPPGRHLTAAEWADIVASDPVLQILDRINEKATERPEWNENYALAHYKAFGEEYRRYVMEKHNVSTIRVK